MPSHRAFIPFGELDEDTGAGLSDTDKARVARLAAFMPDGNGYFQIQATRPNTLGFALTDVPIRQFSEASNNIVHWTDFSEGGHFAAMEKPGLPVADLRRFRNALR
jgi:hypothetical protein